MTLMVQIRNMPSELHRTFKERAAATGMSLSEYLLSELRLLAQTPTLDEMRVRLEALRPVHPSLSPEEAVRLERDKP